MFVSINQPWTRIRCWNRHLWVDQPGPGHNRPHMEYVLVRLSSQIKPISYLKAHAAEIIRTLGDRQQPLIITQNGEAKVVIQDIDSYENMQETIAMLKLLALGNRQIEDGQVQAAETVIARLRERR